MLRDDTEYAVVKAFSRYTPTGKDNRFIFEDFVKVVRQIGRELKANIKKYEACKIANNTDLLTESQLIEQLNRGL